VYFWGLVGVQRSEKCDSSTPQQRKTEDAALLDDFMIILARLPVTASMTNTNKKINESNKSNKV